MNSFINRWLFWAFGWDPLFKSRGAAEIQILYKTPIQIQMMALPVHPVYARLFVSFFTFVERSEGEIRKVFAEFSVAGGFLELPVGFACVILSIKRSRLIWDRWWQSLHRWYGKMSSLFLEVDVGLAGDENHLRKYLRRVNCKTCYRWASFGFFYTSF